ncbi:MAG: RidA family protein, partial [Acidobacteriota bacterium]|nr:RidA family protein [Acidobacteriota bacterium]
ELPEGSLDAHDVVRRGEISPDAVREKARFVMGLMSGRLRGLGVSWDTVTAVDVYTAHPICAMLAEEIVRPMGASAIHGVTWHYSRPPIVSIEFEMDMRGCERELVVE